jgi:hypothetical protein
MENPPFQFPMDLTIRCYQCGKVFDVAVTSRDHTSSLAPSVERSKCLIWAKWNAKRLPNKRRCPGNQAVGNRSLPSPRLKLETSNSSENPLDFGPEKAHSSPP